MLAFLRVPVRSTLGVVALVGAVDVPVVAVAAEVEEPPAPVADALNLPEIVHSRG